MLTRGCVHITALAGLPGSETTQDHPTKIAEADRMEHGGAAVTDTESQRLATALVRLGVLAAREITSHTGEGAVRHLRDCLAL